MKNNLDFCVLINFCGPEILDAPEGTISPTRRVLLYEATDSRTQSPKDVFFVFIISPINCLF